MDTPTCERCEEPNAWVLIDDEYQYLCGSCAMRKGAVYHEGRYRWLQMCSGHYCAAMGVPNFGRNTKEARFFCGGSPNCLP